MNPIASLKRRLALPILAAALAAAAVPAAAQKKVKVVGFYPVYDLTPELTNEQLDNLSHVIIFSLTPSTDGSLTGESIQKDLVNISLVGDLISRAKAKGINVMMAVGGAGKSNNFAALTSNPTARKNYIANLLDLCESEGLAGVDIDWEFPMDGNASGLSAFMKELKAAFGPKNLLVSMDVQASKEVGVNGNMIGSTWTAKYPKDALQACDFVNLMAYDDDYNGGEHAPEDMAKSQTALYSNFVGSTSKVVMGVPFYGKAGFNVRKTYGEIVQQFNPGPSVNSAGGYNFNGPDMLGRKTAYTVTSNNGGIMIWDLLKDARDNRLLKSITAAVKSNGAVLDLRPKPTTLGRPLAAGNPSLRAVGGDLVLSAGSLGRYRLTLTAPDGRVMGSGLSRPGTAGTQIWSLPGLPGGAYLYRIDGIEGRTGDISGGITVRK